MGKACEQEEINACQGKSIPKTNDKKNYTHEQVAEKKQNYLIYSSSLKHTQTA